MRKYFSFFINILFLLLLISIIIQSYILYISLVLTLSAFFIIITIAMKNKKERTLSWAVFWTILLVISIFYHQYNHIRPDTKYYDNIDNFHNIFQDLKIRSKDPNNKDDVLLRAKEVLSNQQQNLNDKSIDKNTYLHIGNICELIFVLDNQSVWSDCAAEKYNEYCVADMNNSNCYITLARFLSLDNSKIEQAKILTKKAIELSNNSKDIDSYYDFLQELNQR